jgi:hypothetical protein
VLIVHPLCSAHPNPFLTARWGNIKAWDRARTPAEPPHYNFTYTTRHRSSLTPGQDLTVPKPISFDTALYNSAKALPTTTRRMACRGAAQHSPSSSVLCYGQLSRTCCIGRRNSIQSRYPLPPSDITGDMRVFTISGQSATDLSTTPNLPLLPLQSSPTLGVRWDSTSVCGRTVKSVSASIKRDTLTARSCPSCSESFRYQPGGGRARGRPRETRRQVRSIFRHSQSMCGTVYDG